MEAIQVLVFIAIIVFAIFHNLRKEQKKAAKRRMAQSSPADNASQPEEKGPMNNPQEFIVQAKTPKKKKNRKAPQAAPVPATAMRSATDANYASDTTPKGTVPRIRFSNVDEARRAFIYSEIFQRKY